MTLREALTAAANTIARRDAETLALHLLHRDRAWLLTHPDTELTPTQLQRLNELTHRRAAHEPLQHLTGQQEFYGLPLRVTPDTLIPRPETEHLVEAAIAWAATQPHALRILDVGTGTGAIALALATHLPTAEITAVDISAAALYIARENAASLNLTDRITFIESDLLAALSTPQPYPLLPIPYSLPFDLIASNPPYIPLTDATTLAPEVRDHEPHAALFAGDDGLAIYRRLIPAAHAALAPNGLLALEFGFGQRNALHTLLEDRHHPWRDIRFLNDYANIPRVVLAHRA
jgi:release factor glutamine methyltransferase